MSKNEVLIIDISSSSDEEDDVPLLHLLRSKMKNVNTPMKDENKKSNNKKRFQDYDADCVVLDYNPFESIDLSVKLSLNNNNTDDVSIISEKGQVREYH